MLLSSFPGATSPASSADVPPKAPLSPFRLTPWLQEPCCPWTALSCSLAVCLLFLTPCPLGVWRPSRLCSRTTRLTTEAALAAQTHQCRHSYSRWQMPIDKSEPTICLQTSLQTSLPLLLWPSARARLPIQPPAPPIVAWYADCGVPVPVV